MTPKELKNWLLMNGGLLRRDGSPRIIKDPTKDQLLHLLSMQGQPRPKKQKSKYKGKAGNKMRRRLASWGRTQMMEFFEPKLKGNIRGKVKM